MLFPHRHNKHSEISNKVLLVIRFLKSWRYIIYIKKIMAENKIDTMKKSIRDLNDLVNDVSESV